MCDIEPSFPNECCPRREVCTCIDRPGAKVAGYHVTHKVSGAARLDFDPPDELPFNRARWTWEPVVKLSEVLDFVSNWWADENGHIAMSPMDAKAYLSKHFDVAAGDSTN